VWRQVGAWAASGDRSDGRGLMDIRLDAQRLKEMPMKKWSSEEGEWPVKAVGQDRACPGVVPGNRGPTVIGVT
jgi:hypothetical protein